MFEGESSFNESGQCLGAPLSHSGVWMLTNLQDMDHRREMQAHIRDNSFNAEAVQGFVSQQCLQWVYLK